MGSQHKDKDGMASLNELGTKLILIAMYLLLNISLNILNKWILSIYGFAFPILLSIAHMGFTFLALAPLMCLKANRDQHAGTLSKQWMGLIGVGTFFAINVGFNNVSLLAISLSLNQVIRASIPVVTAIGSVFIEKKNPSRKEFLSLLLLTGGVCIAVWEGAGDKSSLNGIIMCLAATVSNGLMMCFIGRLMSEKLDVLRMTFYTSPITICVLLPFYWRLESAKYHEYRNHADNINGVYLGLIFLGCMNALSYNIVHSLVIKVTSSVTTTVLGEMKIVLILVLSALMLGEGKVWTFHMLLGCSTAILGFVMYSHCRITHAPSTVLPIIKGIPDLPTSLSDSSRSPLLSPKAQR